MLGGLLGGDGPLRCSIHRGELKLATYDYGRASALGMVAATPKIVFLTGGQK